MSLDALSRGEKAPKPSTLETKLAIRLNRERRPIPLEIRMAFGAHDGARDADMFEAEIKAADLILVEEVGWVKEREALFNRVAQGEIRPDDVPNVRDYSKRLLSFLYATKKGIFLLDTPNNDPLFAEGRDVVNSFEVLTRAIHFEKKPYNEAFEVYVKLTEKFIYVQKKRDDYILQNIDKKLSDAIKTYPVYKTKSSLKVLTIYGTMHAPLLPAVQAIHPRTTRVAEEDGILTHDQEYRQSFSSNKEVSPDLIQRGFASFFLIEIVFPLCPQDFTRSQKNAVLRGLIDSCSVEILTEAYDAIRAKDEGKLNEILQHRLLSAISSARAS